MNFRNGGLSYTESVGLLSVTAHSVNSPGAELCNEHGRFGVVLIATDLAILLRFLFVLCACLTKRKNCFGFRCSLDAFFVNLSA